MTRRLPLLAALLAACAVAEPGTGIADTTGPFDTTGGLRVLVPVAWVGEHRPTVREDTCYEA